jgi:hypothetical protein
MQPTTPVRRLLRVLVLLSTLAITVELCARADDGIKYGAGFFAYYTPDSLSDRDARGIAFNVPNAVYEKWRNNSQGFRGPEFAVSKPDGLLRIACLGSSESYGLHESPDQEWPAQLRNRLDPTRYQVFNASVVGLELLSLREYFDARVLRFAPDVAIVLTNPARYVTRLERLNSESSLPAAPKRLSLRDLPARSRSIPRIRDALHRALGTTMPGFYNMYLAATLKKNVAAAEALRLHGKPPLDRVPAQSLASFERDIDALVSHLRSHGVEPILVSYPSRITRENRLDTAGFLELRQFCVEFSFDGLIDAMEQLNAIVARVAARRGCPFVDAHRELASHRDYFGDAVHYTDRGASKMAELVATQLERWQAEHRVTRTEGRP